MNIELSYRLISERIDDDMSRVYLNARKEYISDHRLSTFYKNIRNLGISYKFRDLESFYKTHTTKGWIVWGNDDISLYHYLLLLDSQYPVLGISAESQSSTCSSIPFISLEDCFALVNNGGYSLICNKTQAENSKKIFMHFKNDQLLIIENHLVGRCGTQYFDYFEPTESEYFLDGGALDGNTTLEFIKWCDGKYNHIYSFEPNPIMSELCKSALDNISNCSFYNAALWNSEGTLLFDNLTKGKWDACISTSGNVLVNCTSIDKCLKSAPISFLKLDVEGAELMVLQGSEDTIRKYKPRMAISVYHNAEDLFNIVDFLIKVNDNYKFALRHYHSDLIETILYVYED